VVVKSVEPPPPQYDVMIMAMMMMMMIMAMVCGMWYVVVYLSIRWEAAYR